MELVNTHSHTGLTGHGEGSVEELVAAAERAGISTLAVTEHYPLSLAMDPDAYLSMPPDALDAYLDALDDACRAHPAVELLRGCEFDYLGEREDRGIVASDFDRFSVVLGSVHFIDGWAFDDPASRDAWEEPGAPDRIWRRYFELWCDAVSSALPFTVMAHPDLPKKFAYYPSYDLSPLYEEAAEACAASGRMIEVNTSGATYACAEMFPAPKLLSAFCRAGVECTVGTDAHRAEQVARGIEEAYRMMWEAGYREVTVPTADGDRRRIPIE